jgi:hypothetical protein
MKYWQSLWIVLVLCTCLHAEPIGQPIPDLKAPSSSEVPRAEKMRSIGTEWWLKNRGLLAEESLKVAGYFCVVRPIPGLADRGDIVWEIRVIHLEGSPTGILWINEKTQKVIGLGIGQKE